MSLECRACQAKCCRYFCFEIDTPETFNEFEDIRWYLLHEGATVHIDDGCWFIAIANKCRNLGPDWRCTDYENRPTICRTYEQDDCDATPGAYGYEQLFTTGEEIDAYARKTLGPSYERSKARAHGLLAKKARTGRRKVSRAN
ncbi:MAG: YkgJ family cysteine cluster protein [Phycisphaerae bacterium]|jgi:Fe-S-cluster containining protein